MEGVLLAAANHARLLPHLFFQVEHVLALVDHQLSAFDRLADVEDQFLAEEGLEEIGTGAVGQGVGCRLGLARGSEHDDRGVGILLGNVVQEFETRLARHHHVQGEQVEVVFI